MKAKTSAPTVLINKTISGSAANGLSDLNHRYRAVGAGGSLRRLAVLAMLLTVVGSAFSAANAAPQQSHPIAATDQRGFAPILLAQTDTSAIDGKIDRLWERAQSEQAAGEYLEALVTVGEALGLSPDSAELLAFREELVAQHETELGIRRDDNQVSGITDLARTEIAAGDYEEAQNTVTRGLRIAPNDATLMALEEEVDAALEAEAEETAQEAAEAERRRVASEVARLQSEARSQLDQGQLEAALVSTDEALALTPDSTALHALRSEIVSRQQARLEQQRLEKQVSESLQQAQTALDAGDLDQAQESVQKALDLAPDAEDVLALKQSVDDAQQAAAEQKRRTHESEVLATEAQHALAASEFEMAQAKLDQALALTPTDGKLLDLESEIKTAQAEADAKIQLDQQAAALRNEAVSLLEQGEYQAALDKVIQALEIAPKNAQLAELATTIEAQQAAEQERQRIAADVARLRDQASKQLEKGEFDAALTSVNEALSLTPEDSELAALRDEITSNQQAALGQQRIDARVGELVQQAQTALNAGKLDQAQTQVQAALELAPEAGVALALKQDIENAVRAAAERERITQEAQALAQEARNGLAAGALDTAQEKLTQALALTPDDDQLLALQKEIEAAQADAEAQEQLRQQLAALKAEATALMSQGEYDAALGKVAEATRLAPEDSELVALGNTIEEQQAAEQERQRIVAEVARLSDQARGQLAQGEFDAALASVNEALTLTPEDADLATLANTIEEQQAAEQERQRIVAEVARLSDQARGQLAEGQFDAALASVKEALALAPEDADLAALAETIEEQQAAEQEWQRIAAETTRLSDQARGQLAEGQFDAALASVKEALTLAPENTDLTALREEITAKQQAALEQQRIDKQVSELLQQAQAALDAGDLDQAQQHVQKALALAPMRQDVLALSQTVDEAQQAAAEVERIAREAEALAMEARADLQSGQLDQAEQKVMQALELTPDDGGLLSLQKQIETAQAEAQAQEQLRQQVAGLKEEAKTLQTQGNFAAALEKIAEASKLASEDDELAGLAKNIEIEEAAEQERIEQRAAPYIQRGDDQLERKDVASARLYYEAAFSEGSIKAATRLGMTFDPVSIRELGIVGMRGDAEKATYWYEIAREAGDPQAAEKLSTLQSQ